MAPEEQKEDWHKALTERNEKRLPEKLLDDLKAAKKRAETGLSKKNSDQMSYFLVEFMGSHEFIWVKENAILENFDPNDDPNVAHAAGNITKKKRSTSYNAKQMDAALEEGKWALEEFESYLNDTCGDQSDDEDEYNDAGYTYDVLCQTDEEAEALDDMDPDQNESDIEEQSELLASEGHLDFSVAGRKLAKQRAAARKKQNAALAKKEKEKKAKAEAKAAEAKTPTSDKREQRELEARRKKRARDHEKMLKDLDRKAKKKAVAEKKSSTNEVRNKKGRAENIVKSFLLRKSLDDKNFNGPGLGPGTSIDPSGLLGMALAFRAAAGEIPFEDSNGKMFIENSWDKIDADEPIQSSERCKRLEEKIDLIQKEITRVNAITLRRRELIKDAETERDAVRAKIFSKGDIARSVDVKVRARKGKSGRKSSEGGGDSRPPSMPTEGAIDEVDKVKSESESKMKVDGVKEENPDIPGVNKR